MTVIQRANSDLRLNPHFHTVFLDGVYSPDGEGARAARGVGRGRCGPEVPEGGDGRGQMFHPAPTQQELEALVCRASKRILRFLQRRGVTLVTAPGDGEVTVVGDETMVEKDPLLAKLLAAATAGAPVPSGPRACTPCPCPTRASRAPVARWLGAQAQARAHRARPRRPPHRQGQLMWSSPRVQLARCYQGRRPAGLRDGQPTPPSELLRRTFAGRNRLLGTRIRRSRPLRWAIRACAKVRQCDMDKVLEPEMPPSIHLVMPLRLAAFQVSATGRFWVSPEGRWSRV